jgi:hypothetical protein
MNIEKLQSRLIAAMRAARSSDAVPFAFEKRVMARLRRASVPDAWTHWGAAMLRACVPCVAIMLLCVAWTAFSGAPHPDGVTLEETVLASVAEPGTAE